MLVKIEKDLSECRRLAAKHKEFFDFDFKDDSSSFKDGHNFVLRVGDSLGYVQRLPNPSTFVVHICINNAKGKKAVEQARLMMNELFTSFGATSLIGPVASDNRKGRVFARAAGFLPVGPSDDKESILYLITKQGFNNRRGKK